MKLECLVGWGRDFGVWELSVCGAGEKESVIERLNGKMFCVVGLGRGSGDVVALGVSMGRTIRLGG